MRLDLVASEDWERAGEALRVAMNPANGEIVRVHAGLEPGALELALGLAQIYSHKRALAVVKGNSPVFDQVVPWFQREAYQLQSIMWSALPDRAAIETWIAGLKKETAFVMVADDNPVTGALQPVDLIESALAEKKMFLIRVSHGSQLLRNPAPCPYAVHLRSVDGGFAMSVSGARLRVAPLFSHRLPWSAEKLVARYHQRVGQKENRSVVENFEKEFKAERVLPEGADRLYDRAVLSFPNVSGEALLARVGRKIGLSALDESMNTANLCRWDSTRLMKNWWEHGPSDDVVRGLVAFSPELCGRKDFARDLRATYEELLALQTW